MENYCAFSKNHKCLKWTDYQLTLFELKEADDYSDALKALVRKIGNQQSGC